MNPPFHPAVVHFPIALIATGALGVLLALFVRKSAFCWAVAAVLALGAGSTFYVFDTGEAEEERIEHTLSASAEHLLEEHEDAGRATMYVSLAAALAALGAAWMTTRGLKQAWLVRLAAALLAVCAAGAVLRTGKLGGELVYLHGAGVQLPADAGAVPHDAHE